jgi:L-ascorbate metabolism protein UlaG (beta-lactamase superfamily)
LSGNSVTWLGHSTVAIHIDGLLVVTDPVLRRRVAHLRRQQPVGLAALQGLGAVVVSHVHYDHLDLRSLSHLDHAVPVVVPVGAGALLRRRGFGDVREVEAGDELEVGAVRIRATHAEHDSARRPGTRRIAAVGFVLAGTRSVYFAGDTDLFAGMAEIGPVDLALLPVAGWGPRLPPGHLDPTRAAEALSLIRPRMAIPIHWGTYAPWRPSPGDDTPAREFATAAANLAPEVEVRVLQLGETSSLD